MTDEESHDQPGLRPRPRRRVVDRRRAAAQRSAGLRIRRSTSASAEKGYTLLSGVVRLWLRGPFVELVVDGLGYVPPTGRVLVASNHPSMLSTLVPWAILRRNPAVLIISYAFWIPVLGTVFKRLGNIPVRRDLRIHRLLDRSYPLERAACAKAAVDILRLEGAVQLYPEGTIPRRWMLRRDVLQDLRPGVARIATLTGSPVVPVGMRLGWRLGRRGVRHTVTVKVGAPILPGTTDESELLRQVRAAIHSLSGLPYEEADGAREPSARGARTHDVRSEGADPVTPSTGCRVRGHVGSASGRTPPADRPRALAEGQAPAAGSSEP